ncbi:ankyrin [Lentithecium fluviatile CBS 122367]|uniref:Ankyrin n=1 Tax=Lentithecium fluviatile CBS 122367 TaxID=1168545 RepID=A0A6G1J8I2_9PLEO|nr:ankyrin [Lentithecium fluviatile CBS 122367]
MTANTASPAAIAIFNRVLTEFQQELSMDEVDDFNFITADDLKKAVHQLQEEQKSKKRMQNLRRISAFLEAMDQFDKVIQVFLNTTNYLGFVWGPAKFMLLVAGAYSDALNTLLDAYQEVGENMPLLMQYEALVSQSPSLQEILGLIYKDILTFHGKAMKHFRQRAWKQLFQATWRNFRSDFGTILTNLQSHRRLLDSQAIFLGVSETMKAMAELHETRRLLEEENRRKLDEDTKLRQLAVTNWLRAADSTSDHQDALSVQENNSDSGLWLFKQNTIRDWVDQNPSTEPLLWINGRPGAEHCRRQHPAVAFFYCKHGDPARDNFIGFARSIISQFAQLNPSLAPFIFDKQSASGVDSLRSSKLAKELLDVAVETFDALTLIVDGLDECVKSRKEEISSWVRSFVARAGEDGSRNLRCCILSQDDNDTGRLLKGLTTFKITVQHNTPDILQFCQRRANEIGHDYGLPPQDVQNLAECVTEKADGMFLYAKLVMDNLSGQVCKSDVKKEMSNIPPDLNQVYQRIRHRIFVESSPREQGVAKTLFSWLLCAKRPLKWYEIQGAMCLDPETGLFDEDRRLVRDIKHFCGSLVEIRNGSAICFVHLTAKFWFPSFLRDEAALPKQLEHLNLTSLCFVQLSLDSHDADITQDPTRGYLLRGEYAFSDYAIIYAFDHLIDVLSPKEAPSTADYERLRTPLRRFVSKRVTAPTEQASADRSMDNRFQGFKDDDFLNCLRHAVKFHEKSLAKTALDVETEPVLTLLPQLLRTRTVLEDMSTGSGLSRKAESLYGQNIFKCAQPQCEWFHEGFSTPKGRDNHRTMHQRIYFCTISGCQSSMIGFTSSKDLKNHEKDYHGGVDDPNGFPWNGALETLDICEEIRKGNDAAFDLWMSRKWLRKTISKRAAKLLIPAIRHSRHRMLKRLLKEIVPDHTALTSRLFTAAIQAHDEEAVAMLLGHFARLKRSMFTNIIEAALSLGHDSIAIRILGYPKSPVLFRSPKAMQKNLVYLKLAIRHGRETVLRYLVHSQQLDPMLEDENGHTSLIVAAEFDRIGIARYLVDTAGCNRKSASALQMAGRQGHEEFISQLFSDELSSDRNVRTWYRTAQLRNFTRLGDYQKVKELLDGGSLHVDEVDTQNRSPWLWAVEKAHSKIVELFLPRKDILFTRTLETTTKYKSPNALHLAAQSGSEVIVQMLLESAKFDHLLETTALVPRQRADGLYVAGSPHHIAKAFGHDDIANMIKDYNLSWTWALSGPPPEYPAPSPPWSGSIHDQDPLPDSDDEEWAAAFFGYGETVEESEEK